MDPMRSPGGGSGVSGYTPAEMAESLRLDEEIQCLIRDASSSTGRNSFTALLGLSPDQAVELLHDHDSGGGAASAADGDVSICEMPRPLLGRDHAALLRLPLGCTPTFPSDDDHVDRAARFSIFAAEESPAVSSSCFGKPKMEPSESSGRSQRFPNRGGGGGGGDHPQRTAKRKSAVDKCGKAKAPASKKNKLALEDKAAATPATKNIHGEELPYVHVRARRGQATDGHSLAERARREKINVRMKLLQELVPGCSQISGTALVLDEIINHVRALQRQVEFLSMILSAVYPRMDLPGLDGFLPGELAACNGNQSMPLELSMCDSADKGAWHQQQFWQVANPQASNTSDTIIWEGEDSHSIPRGATKDAFIPCGTIGYSTANMASDQSNQLKKEA